MKTQHEIENLKNPSVSGGNISAMEINKLNLKIEGLELVNKQMSQQVLDSKRVMKYIELACLKEIEKIEQVIKSQVQSMALKKGIPNNAQNTPNRKINF